MRFNNFRSLVITLIYLGVSIQLFSQEYNIKWINPTDSLYGNQDSLIGRYSGASPTIISSNESETLEKAVLHFTITDYRGVKVVELTPENTFYKHGYHIDGFNNVSVIEDNMITPIGTFSSTDVFSIYRDKSGYLNYDINGNVYYTSSQTVFGKLKAAVSINGNGELLFFSLTFLKTDNIVWNERTNTDYSASIERLKSNSSTSWESGAFSYNKVAQTEEGYYIFKADNLGGDITAFGVSASKGGNNFSNMDYCFLINGSTGMVDCYDHGSLVMSHGPINFDEYFKIRRRPASNDIQFQIDNVTIFSVPNPVGDLHADVAFDVDPANLNNLKSSFPFIAHESTYAQAQGISATKGKYLLTDKNVRVSYTSHYYQNSDTLQYSLYDKENLAIAWVKPGDPLPPGAPLISVSTGSNLLSFDFSNVSGFDAEQDYSLLITDPQGHITQYLFHLKQ